MSASKLGDAVGTPTGARVLSAFAPPVVEFVGAVIFVWFVIFALAAVPLPALGVTTVEFTGATVVLPLTTAVVLFVIVVV
jgi:hypothetical protein